MVPYDAKAFGAVWSGAPAKADCMAMAAIDLKMRADTYVKTDRLLHGEGESWGTDESIATPVEIGFLVAGGQVKAYIGAHPDERPFPEC